MRYDIGDWKQIKNYGKDIPKIVRTLLDMDGITFIFGNMDKKETFKEIMNDINILNK